VHIFSAIQFDALGIEKALMEAPPRDLANRIIDCGTALEELNTLGNELLAIAGIVDIALKIGTIPGGQDVNLNLLTQNLIGIGMRMTTHVLPPYFAEEQESPLACKYLSPQVQLCFAK
jgi:hypothetical protein